MEYVDIFLFYTIVSHTWLTLHHVIVILGGRWQYLAIYVGNQIYLYKIHEENWGLHAETAYRMLWKDI